MLFIISCIDKPDHAHIRAQTRPEHLAYLEGIKDRIHAAGPTLSDAEGTPTGSVLIIDFEGKAQAEAFADGDPYNKAGLFQSVAVSRWKQVLPSVVE